MSLQSSTPRPRGKERWNLLRDVHLGATAARSVTTLKEPIELGNWATAAKTLPPASLAPQLEKQQIVPTTSCSQQSVCSPLLSEPAPEPGLEGEAGEEPEADAGSQGGEGEDFSDWSSEVSNEKLILDDIPTIKVHDTKLVEHLSHNRQSESGANNKREFQIPLHLLQSGSSARMRLSQRKQSTRRAEEGGTRGATSTDLMASMVNGFTSLTNFKFSGEKAESEDEVHNAWGDEDTADDFGNRVHDLQEARGITLGPAPSAARARRAQRKQKQKPEEVCARQSSLVANDHSNSNIAGPDRQTFFAASGVVTSLLSNLSMSMSISGTAENVKDNAKYPEAEQQSGMAMPMLTSHSLGRERYARRKGKLDSTALPQGTLSPSVSAGVESASSSASVALSDVSSLVRLGRRRANPPGFAEAADSFVVYGTNHGSSLLAAATSSLVAFQRLFQTEDEETYSIWSPDDTPEQYQQRLTALERARGEPNASMLHHRLMRRRKKRQQVSHGTQDAEEDPFLLR